MRNTRFIPARNVQNFPVLVGPREPIALLRCQFSDLSGTLFSSQDGRHSAHHPPQRSDVRKEGPLCAETSNIGESMGGYPIAIQSYLRYSLRDGRIMRRETYPSTHLRSKGGSLRLVTHGYSLSRAQGFLTAHHDSRSVVQRTCSTRVGMVVYPGVYMEACIPGCIYLPCT